MYDDETITSTLKSLGSNDRVPKVKELMTPKITTVSRMQTAQQVMQIFFDKKITAAPVIDEKHKVVGLISDLDILIIGSLNMQNLKLGELPLKIAVEKSVIAVAEDDNIKKALMKIIKHRIGRVVVVDQYKKCVGILSRKDLVRYFLQQSQ